MNHTRYARRLYVGQIPPGTLDVDMQNFFDNVLAQCLPSGFSAAGEKPVMSVYINQEKLFGFIEFRTQEITAASLTLDNIKFNGGNLKLKRPNDFKQEFLPSMRWSSNLIIFGLLVCWFVGLIVGG